MQYALLIIENQDIDTVLTLLNQSYVFEKELHHSLYHKDTTLDKSQFLSFLFGNIGADYEPEDRKYIDSKLENPEFFYIEFTSFVFFKEVMLFLGKHAKIMIDNDHGHIFEQEEFSALKEWHPEDYL